MDFNLTLCLILSPRYCMPKAELKHNQNPFLGNFMKVAVAEIKREK